MDSANEDRRAFLRMTGSLALVAMLAGCGGGSETYRYRMTVYVDTPAGPRSGSSVIEVVTSPPFLMGSTQSNVRGEAVAVDLPGGTLFALLRSSTNPSAAGNYASNAYRDAMPHGYDWKTGVDTLKRQTAPALLPRDNYYPRFVRFRDPHDARTVEVLDPSNLGAGARINHIVIQMTDDPVTETIEGRLPDFGKGSGYGEWLGQLDFHDQRRIFTTDFRRGF
jgi:hypothetical protein